MLILVIVQVEVFTCGCRKSRKSSPCATPVQHRTVQYSVQCAGMAHELLLDWTVDWTYASQRCTAHLPDQDSTVQYMI